MKVVISAGIGGFDTSITKECVEECIRRGMTYIDDADPKNFNENFNHDFVRTTKNRLGNRFYTSFHLYGEMLKKFRTNQILVQVVEEMVSKSNQDELGIKIVEIPFDSTDGWDIRESESGYERVEENHGTWS